MRFDTFEPKAQKRRRARVRRGGRAPRRPLWPSLALIVLFAAAGAWLREDPEALFEEAPRADFAGAVSRIVDGDTFYVEGVDTRIRIWGLDAPEANAPGGARATRTLSRLALGKNVVCERMDIDRYQRIVGRCRLENGADIAALMIESGAATEYVRYSGGYYSGRETP